MSRVPRGLRAVAIYLRYDLASVVRNPGLWFTLFGVPLMLVLVFVLIAGPMVLVADTVVEAPRVWVEGAAPSWEHGLRHAFHERDLEVVGFGPAGSELLEAGEADVVVVLPADVLEGGSPEVRLGPDAMSFREPSVRWAVTTWRVDTWTEERVGAHQPAEVVLADGSAVPPPDGQAARAPPGHGIAGVDPVEVGTATLLRGGVGLFVVGLFGVMLGLSLGMALDTSIRSGFNHVLAVGTSTRVIFVTEMLDGVVVQTLQAVIWWSLYGGLAWGLAGLGGAAPPAPLVFLVDLPLLVVLASAAIVTSTSASLVALRAMTSLPITVRERLPGLASLVVMLALLVGAEVVSPTALGWLGLLPVVGPVALWLAWQAGETWVLAVLVAQAAWVWVAVEVGAWVFGLDESPWEALRRRR
ncbi:MAG: hypothetical protein H6732_19480 [Alphaproteobacteria bacterium]|nr:hypothetical protein [Alphaproteobacteria bacterium]